VPKGDEAASVKDPVCGCRSIRPPRRPARCTTGERTPFARWPAATSSWPIPEPTRRRSWHGHYLVAPFLNGVAATVRCVTQVTRFRVDSGCAFSGGRSSQTPQEKRVAAQEGGGPAPA
jgi:hypothetical protein